MRKARFTEEQMVAIIREGDREPVWAAAKRHGISEQTIYTWRKRFGGLQANEVRRLKHLEAENVRLEKTILRRFSKNALSRRLGSPPTDIMNRGRSTSAFSSSGFSISRYSSQPRPSRDGAAACLWNVGILDVDLWHHTWEGGESFLILT